MPVLQFVPLFEQLCEVVQSAHDQGIVHRDIKPSNVMVIARAGRLMPKLLDFGIAKALPAGGDPSAAHERPPVPAPAPRARDGAPGLTHQGQVLGSPAYMAPEQWLDATAAGPPADQYALALLAYEVLTGSHAFTGSLEVLEDQHHHAPLPALPASLPPALHAVLARASAKRAAQRFENLAELTGAVRNALGASAGESTTASSDGAALDDATPYPGLAAYTAADHASFVGRERDVEELIQQLDRQPIVTVIGPSGSGKTSFLAAGLVPALAAGRIELIRPGSDPLGALEAVAGLRDPARRPEAGRPTPSEDDRPAAIAAALIGRAEELAGGRGAATVVLVDQAEELFTLCAEPRDRTAFADVLVQAAASPRVRVVLALRDDFLCRVEQLPAWRRLLGRAVHVLGVPRRDDLERMIAGPARRLGYSFDDPALPREIAEQVADRPGALPLVAFTVAQLWAHRDRERRRLTRSAYDEIGGVTGALVRHADRVVDGMSAPERRQVRLVFQRLINPEGARSPIGRAELESSLGGSSPSAVVDRLLAARLIVSQEDDAGDRIEVIHESLGATWPRLAAWRREDADGSRLQEQLAVAARHWNDRARPGDLLWRGDALDELRRWFDRGDRSVTPVERAFADACIASAGRRRRARIAVLALVFAVLSAGIIGLVTANRQIADQRAAAIERLGASFEERGRVALADGDDVHAMLYLAEASRLGARGPGLDLMTSHALVSLGAGLEILGHGKAGIMLLAIGETGLFTLGTDYALSRWDRSGRETEIAHGVSYAALAGDRVVAASPQGDVFALDADGRPRWRAERAVTADPSLGLTVAASVAAGLVVAYGSTATLRELDTGHLRGELAHDHGVSAAAFARDGTRLATGDLAGVVRIWDTASAAAIATCEPHAGIVRVIAFAPDGRSVVSGGNDGEVRVCDAATGATLHRLLGHSQPVVTVDITADGSAIVSGGRDGKPRLWDARTGLLVRMLEGHRGTVMSARFAPDGERLLTLSFDGTARLWARDGTALGSLQGHAGQIFAGGWDRDGRHVITTSVDGAIRRWDPARAIKVTPQRAHSGPVTDVAISRDDRWVVTAGADGRGALWDQRSLRQVCELSHGARLTAAAVAPDGGSALTTDAAGRARLWRVPGCELIAELSPARTATFGRDGGVITADDRAVTFWTASGRALGAVPLDYAPSQLILDPAGRWLFVRGETSSVLVIDTVARAACTRLVVEDRRVNAIAADVTRVAVSDGTAIRVWRLGSWAPLGALLGHKDEVDALWFAAGGRLISASSEATLVWRRDRQLAAKLADSNRTFALAESSDGTLFATTSSDGALRLWDAASNRLLLQLPGHRLPALALQLTHDGARAISGGNDGRLVVWDLARRTRTASELMQIVRCRIPLRLEGDVALPRDLDFGDPICRSPSIDD
jgi:WD40 repeat protein